MWAQQAAYVDRELADKEMAIGVAALAAVTIPTVAALPASTA